ncbi:hydantoinase/oxoprolinase family protein [Oleidesulfovibrio sp.]|uniref:hydantoinase/oxoprolinase family protein n=1 Tax=Oleidesulfovibrio sp. TaxID=2909707 RepID=UPI003A8A4D31
MYLGIDVGGTHTDAVVLDAEKNIITSAKVPTLHHDLLASVTGALEAVLQHVPAADIKRLNLSTTLSTNAIVEGKTEDVGVLVSAGPGIDAENFRQGGFYYTLSGSIDHRGKEIAAIDPSELAAVAQNCCDSGIKVYAAVGKFSTRNPEHEQRIADEVLGCGDFVSMGHRLSGQLSFPRRVATAYYNSAVWRLYNRFADAIERSAREKGITAPVHILKADGGTMPLSVSRQVPVESILSGPAASVMGIVALYDIREDAIILDIGGTTTDIAIFASGSPVIENDGIAVGSYPTLVRALRTLSIGIGGDSRLRVAAGAVRVGPDRSGPAVANGGKQPALMDAMNYLGVAQAGDVEASKAAIGQLASLWDMYPDKLAQDALDTALAAIASAVQRLLDEVNSQPVYTIIELLEGAVLNPGRVFVMGGPAAAFAPLLRTVMNKRVDVPQEHAVANAIGAALTRTTAELELFADTEKGRMFVPTLGLRRDVSSRYTLNEAIADARKFLVEHLEFLGVTACEADVDVIESGSFNMVDDYGGRGRNIRVKCQVRPGISM